MTSPSWIVPSRTRWRFRAPSAATCSPSPVVPAEALRAVREPLAWMVPGGPAVSLADLRGLFAHAARGVEVETWRPPAWLLPHQCAAAQRLAGALDVFGAAVFADAVGMGKTFVALAFAADAESAVAVVPASLRHQWRSVAARTGVSVDLVTHEALSRGGTLPRASLVIVDEAHRFRNPATKRYARLASEVRDASVLLMTATPVVNGSADLLHLLRLVLADHALAPLGLPSLERALAEGAFALVLHAAAPLLVARSAAAAGMHDSLPAVHDRRVLRPPPVAPARLDAILAAIDALAFAGFGPTAPGLLRRHLLYRLASSVEAARETARRHVTYCHRAREAALRGERLTRAQTRAVFGPDDAGQLGLALDAGGGTVPDITRLDRELDRLDRLRSLLAREAASPKATALHRILAARQERKTIVFTSARATALALARRLEWRRAIVVTGDGARIASGALSTAEAFACFAPRAHRRRAPEPAMDARVLIATDLASEGLDLQDADAVVHYDLPWNPVRLTQRAGRIRRLGSRHRAVEIWWFAPPDPIEERIDLASRIARKLTAALATAVPDSARVGRAQLASTALAARERLAAGDGGTAGGWCIASGGMLSVAVVRWDCAGRAVRQLVAFDGSHAVITFDRILEAVCGLRQADPAAPPGPGHLQPLLDLLRQRITDLHRGPTDTASLRLARRLLARARRAAHRRDERLLGLLDAALARVRDGLAVGPSRALRELLDRRPFRAAALAAWLADTPGRVRSWSGPVIEAVALVTGPDGPQATL